MALMLGLVRFVIGALGAVAVTVGIVLVAVAVGLMSWVGNGETVTLPEVHLDAPDGRVAEDIDFLFDDDGFVPDLGFARLRVRTTDGSDVFAGIAHRDDARRFLQTASDAGDQAFWITSAHGSTAHLGWDIEPGDWSFVVVSAGDASDIVIEGEVTAARFRRAAATVGGLGIAASVAGALLLVVAFSIGRAATSAQPSEPVPAGT